MRVAEALPVPILASREARAPLVPAPILVPGVGTAGVQPSPAPQVRAAITQFIPAAVHVPHVGVAGVQLLLAPFPVPSVMVAVPL